MLGALTVVLYHDVAAEPDPLVRELDYTTHPDRFADHIKYFSSNFDIIGIGDLSAGNISKKSLLITFDDALKSVIETAGPILKSFNAPALFFLNPAPIISAFVPTDNLISYAVGEIGFPAVASVFGATNGAIDNVTSLIGECVSRQTLPAVLEKSEALLRKLSTTHAQLRQAHDVFISPEQVRNLGRYGIDVGNHSYHHTFLRNLTQPELNTEIGASRTELQRLSDAPVLGLSIPYGKEADATPAVLDVARASGHKAIFLVHARSNRFRPAKDIYYRVSLTNEPVNKLGLKLGVFPLLRSVRNGFAV